MHYHKGRHGGRLEFYLKQGFGACAKTHD